MPITWDTASRPEDYLFGVNAAIANPLSIKESYMFNTNVCFVSKGELNDILNNFAKQVYNLITEHIAVDISEEEFMKLLEG